MTPIEMRPRTEDERRLLRVANGHDPAAEDHVARAWTVIALLLGLALVVSFWAR